MKKKNQKATREQLENNLISELDRLRKEVDKAYDAYAREPDPALAAPLQNRWTKLLAQLTQLSRVQPKADLDAKKVLLKSDVEATWSRTLKEFRSALEALPRRSATLRCFAKCNPVDVELALRAEIDEVLKVFAGPDEKSGPFWKRESK